MKQYWNKTKVVCTIGPACKNADTIKKMILGGMDIARFNFSHGVFAEHGASMKNVRGLALKLRASVAVLQDLPGPKIRIGLLKSDFVELRKGQRFFLTSKNIAGDAAGVGINDPAFVRDLKKKDIVYLNDALVKLVVVSRNREEVFCEVLTGGRIYPRKGVNCPTRILRTASVTPFDMKCLRFGMENGVDFVAVSFVQRPGDIIKVKNFLKRKNKNIFVIAKIERKIAFQEIDGIIRASDAVMVARGDLGIEADYSEVPFLQKELIKKCNRYGRPVITATQMLESMVNSPQPTRAEVSDVANAIIDGTDALMLSEETAMGNFPVEALLAMVRIAEKAESELHRIRQAKNDVLALQEEGLLEAFSLSAVKVAANIKAKVIIVPTLNAGSLSWLSRLRPGCAVAAITSEDAVYKKLILFWGVFSIKIEGFKDLPKTLRQCVELVKTHRLAARHERVVIMLTSDNMLFSSNIMEVRTLD
ncbi:MAG: pyruvate kinase [Candidatus Omnitrophica bacterium]|nr:pyruvate kinase [Candidatus Omnitrophota bacterium]